MMLRRFALLSCLLGLATGAARAQAVCTLDDVGVPGNCFRVYSTTGQLLDVAGPGGPTVLCAGSRIRVRYCGGETIPRNNIRYGIGCSGVGTDTVTTLTVPTTSPFIILQQRPNPFPAGGNGYPNRLGLQYSRSFEVRAAPVPAVQVRYCGVPFSQVYVAITNAQANIRYEIQLGNGPRQPVTQPAGAAYAVPAGATGLTVYANYTDVLLCEGNASVTFSAPTAAAPTLQRLAVGPAGLTFTFSGLVNDPSYQYLLDPDAGAGTVVPSTSTTFTLPGGSLGSCYRLRLTDACGLLNLRSAVLCPVDLQVSSVDRQNTLSWSQAAGSAVTAYDVLRDGQLLTSVAPTARQYTDPAVTCGVSYRYQVVARSGAASSESAERTVTTVAAQAPPAPRLTASFRLDNGVDINLAAAAADTASRLLLRRTLGATTTDLPFTRRRPVVDQPGPVTPALVPCYAGRLTDPCGNASGEGPAACPPVLGAAATDREGNRISLNFTEPAGQGSDWRYRLLLLDEAGQELSSSALSATAQPVQAPAPPADRQVLRYRLEATSAAGLVVFSNVAVVTRKLVVFIPTAFSPNGDGLNDVLEIKGRFLKSFTLKLYDRNGVEVFRATDRNQTWDGRIRGTLAAPQVFSYQFEATDEAGQRIVQRATVTLLR
ncbi:gliding motility-associated C-terminal domain-containing protein [Hymenobacter sp. 15J16-1T3B]|uniref:T9SS type B sorting domain-containing protein n=1 Tax=Hymenobacter sp. 15J16-1T3B TaxID=2886941 RepID=UPI001D111467|nr:gliding motility-associated C-terminal domain-containing protein [Hymenobacter sp. 15J16-1T3B]MCC3156767.1 gliding motility-associated C-terminal domain-containing protein [Hymenobacter sp. 15J16-1T3B]